MESMNMFEDDNMDKDLKEMNEEELKSFIKNNPALYSAFRRAREEVKASSDQMITHASIHGVNSKDSMKKSFEPDSVPTMNDIMGDYDKDERETARELDRKNAELFAEAIKQESKFLRQFDIDNILKIESGKLTVGSVDYESERKNIILLEVDSKVYIPVVDEDRIAYSKSFIFEQNGYFKNAKGITKGIVDLKFYGINSANEYIKTIKSKLYQGEWESIISRTKERMNL